MLDPGKETALPRASSVPRHGVDDEPTDAEDAQSLAESSSPPASAVLSDRALLAAHLANDPYAFNELARRHRLDLWIVALRVLGDRDDADDAVQEALVRAFRGARTYRGESEVRAWLRAVVENTSRTLARQRDRNGREVVGLPEGHAERPSRAGPERQVVHFSEAEERLARVPEPYRRTFILIKIHGFTYAEAAAIEAVPVNTVRSRLGRAKAALVALEHEDGGLQS